MLHNIDINQMEHLMETNADGKRIIRQLLENHRIILSTIVHEMRNQLTLLSSALQVTEAKHPEIHAFPTWRQAMIDLASLRHLLRDLSGFNNRHLLRNCSLFSLERLLENLALSFSLTLEHLKSNIAFSTHIESPMEPFFGDQIKLKEVILNLLQNAKDAVGNRGRITLSAWQQTGFVRICVSDTGCGIAPTQLDSIFEPFVSYKRNSTGLGLFLCRQIVTAHHGSLTVSSKPGQGATFFLLLPAKTPLPSPSLTP